MSIKYKTILFRLMPKGLFDEFDQESNISKLFTPIAGKLQDVENYIISRANNIFPQLSDSESLKKWSIALNTNEDLESILFQLRKSGGANQSFYLGLLNGLGFNSDDDKVVPVVRAFNCNSNCNDATYFGEGWRFVFLIYLPFDPVSFNCNSNCNDPLRLGQSKSTIELFEKSKPAHTAIRFLYYEEE